MLDSSPITTALKPVLPPPPQAMPRVAEEMKPVPEAETQEAVPPPAAPKGSEPGLGENVDLYDAPHLLGNAPDAAETAETVPYADMPFLKPLGDVRGQAIDARI